jgi:hypothetical protein
MMSAARVALASSPRHRGQNDENTDIDGYCENDEYDKQDPGDHRDPL